MATEFELKYLADEKALEALSRRFPGGRHIAMSTTYYDTRDSDLSARRWTLRRRQENDTFVCTLKTPPQRPRRQHKAQHSEARQLHEPLIRTKPPAKPLFLLRCHQIPHHLYLTAFPMYVDKSYHGGRDNAVGRKDREK